MTSLYFEPVTGDPPEVDAAYPPGYASVAIPSADGTLHGIAYTAQGPGPHPVAVFLHGIPGHERNFDLAQAARRGGWTALSFGYRGAWGSTGRFRFAHVLEDVQAALAWLRRAETGDSLRADGARVALVGLSMGAWAALLTAAETPALLGAAALAPWNVGAYAALAADPDALPAALGFLQAVSAPLISDGPEALLAEMTTHAEAWEITRHAAALRDRHLLIVGGAEDDEAPPPFHYAPLVAALRGAPGVQHQMIAHADHVFSARRIELARVVVGWLDALRRG